MYTASSPNQRPDAKPPAIKSGAQPSGAHTAPSGACEDAKMEISRPPPPPIAARPAAPPKAPDPGDALNENLKPKLADARTERQLRFHLNFYGAELKPCGGNGIKTIVTKKLVKELKAISDWHVFHIEFQ